MDDKIDDMEALQLWIAYVVKNAKGADADRVMQAMDMMLAGVAQLGLVLQQRCIQLASQKQPRKAKPPKAAPAKGPQQRKLKPSNVDTAQTKNDAEDRSEAFSSIQQGIRQAQPSQTDQQRALRGYVYGAQNDEVAFRKAAQAITR